jgi:amidase
MAREAFESVGQEVREALVAPTARFAAMVGTCREIVISPEGLDTWFGVFRTIQAAEVWANVGAGVKAVNPRLGPGVKERLQFAAEVTPEMVEAARAERAKVRLRLADILRPGDILCLPTSPRVAPLRGMPPDKIEVEYRHQAMRLLCVSGLAGLPQLSLPIATLGGLPLGLSLMAPHNCDIDLLMMAELVMAEAP